MFTFFFSPLRNKYNFFMLFANVDMFYIYIYVLIVIMIEKTDHSFFFSFITKQHVSTLHPGKNTMSRIISLKCWLLCWSYTWIIMTEICNTWEWRWSRTSSSIVVLPRWWCCWSILKRSWIGSILKPIR